VRSRMRFQGKRELLAQLVARYQEAPYQQKRIILDEFVAATGSARKDAIRLLTRPTPPVVAPISRPRPRRSGAAVREA